jgi:DNA-binding winged helix-turn-helix (wHTH) protein
MSQVAASRTGDATPAPITANPSNQSRQRHMLDFRVGDWLIQPDLGRVRNRDRVVRLRPQLLDVLACLAGHAGRTLTKDELFAAVWMPQHVTDSALTRCIAELRRTLGDDIHQPRYIETIPKRGYRLVASVSFAKADVVSTAPPIARMEPNPERGQGVNVRPGALRRIVVGILRLTARIVGVVTTRPDTREIGDSPARAEPPDVDDAVFQIEEWLVQPALCRLTRDTEVVRVRPQLMELLRCLVRGGGRTVSRDQLLAEVWEGQHIAEIGVTRSIAELRRALGDTARTPRFIETVPKRGYRLLACVHVPAPEVSLLPGSSTEL